jgi:hypothetical protein
VTALLADELRAYKVSKGGFQFSIGKPPSAALVRKLVKARLAEIDAAKKKPAKKKSVKRSA